jgi:hypothetical protein
MDMEIERVQQELKSIKNIKKIQDKCNRWFIQF